jgi:hypothetical protein
MKDGFVRWAESTAPAREGGSQKIPCAIEKMPKHGSGAIEDAVKIVQDMTDFYYKAKEYTPKVKAALRDPTVQQSIAKGKYAPTMEKIASYMEKVGLGHAIKDAQIVRKVGGSKSFKKWCQEEESEHMSGGFAQSMGRADGKKEMIAKRGGRIGMGKSPKFHSAEEHIQRCLQGGMSMDQALESLKKYGKAVYDWLKANKKTTKAVLTSKYLNEELGTNLPRQIQGYMEMIGLGKQGGFNTNHFDFARQIQEQQEAEAQKRNQEMQGWVANAAKKQSKQQSASQFDINKYVDEQRAQSEKLIKDHQDKLANFAKTGKGSGRKPSAYAEFVREFARSHPGPDLMKRAGQAWRSR